MALALRAYNLDLLDRSDYGGFWQRTLALVIDGLILYFPALVLAVLLGAWIHGDLQWQQRPGIEVVASQAAWAIYSIYFWTGAWRATPGKRIVGLIVVTDDGFTLGAGKSIWRVVAQLISGLVIVGPLLVVFSERRQALHDLLAGTVVVKARAAERVKVPEVAKDDARGLLDS